MQRLTPEEFNELKPYLDRFDRVWLNRWPNQRIRDLMKKYDDWLNHIEAQATSRERSKTHNTAAEMTPVVEERSSRASHDLVGAAWLGIALAAALYLVLVAAAFARPFIP